MGMIISVKEGITAQELIEVLQDAPKDTSITGIEMRDKLEDGDDFGCEIKACACYGPKFVEDIHMHNLNMILEDQRDFHLTQDDFDNDNTAMTDPEQRGIITHYPLRFEEEFPEPVRSNIFVERHNNTMVADVLMEIDNQAIKAKTAIDNKANEAKARIDMDSNRLKYETLLEYNTQCGMHRESVMMCRIVDDFEKRKK